MRINHQMLMLLITIAVIILAPYVGLYIQCGEIPKNFFHFPATEPEKKPGFNWVAVLITSGFWIAYLLLLFFPRVFGFKRTAVQRVERQKVKFPYWFWLGILTELFVFRLFISRSTEPKWLLDWALVPLWWGFISLLDGIVYYRNSGRSLISRAPGELIAMGVLSISGWMIFEYFNFFTKLNWYYPFAGHIQPHGKFLVYALVGSSAFIPMCFEWYHLLRTFPALTGKYKSGPKRAWPVWLKVSLLVIFVVLLYFYSYLADGFFYLMWLAPLFILSIVCGWLDMWTPFKPIKEKGDWTALILFSTTFLIEGFFIEAGNALSMWDEGTQRMSANPGAWRYCIPYVTFGKIFEMPFLGYLGYVPFSIYSFIWFLTVSFLMNIRHEFTFGEQFQ